MEMRLMAWYINAFPAPSGRGQASPLQRQRFFGFAVPFFLVWFYNAQKILNVVIILC
ncbi:MAG: hypothetical protein LBQ66_03965 [Planctomycetaceae bacterium]|nr:hypothetical protein [Planctomycetaceae bacterium]